VPVETPDEPAAETKPAARAPRRAKAAASAPTATDPFREP
jgi:hypothetical protein